MTIIPDEKVKKQRGFLIYLKFENPFLFYLLKVYISNRSGRSWELGRYGLSNYFGSEFFGCRVGFGSNVVGFRALQLGL